MRMIQGGFSFLPDLTDDQIRRQIDYCLVNGWAISVEAAEEIEPRHTHWTTWGEAPLAVRSSAEVMAEIKACRGANPTNYIRVNAFDPSRGAEAIRLSFIINRPRPQPTFRVERPELPARGLRARSNQAFAMQRASGSY